MNQLATLQNKPPQEAKKVLAALSTTLLPQPYEVDVAALYGTSQETINSVLSEIRKRLRIREDDQSQQAQTKLVSFVSDTLSQITFANTDKNAVKARLGQRGDLSLNLYEISYSSKFNQNINDFGVSKSQIQRTLKEPDSYEHLKPITFSLGEEVSISLFIKNFIGKNEKNSFTILVITDRKGFILQVNQVWKIYHDEVNISQKTPHSVLEEFANIFGAEITVGDKTKRYYKHEIVKIGSNDPKNSFSFKVQTEKEHVYYANAQYGGRTNRDSFEVFQLYFIDLDKYKDSLRKHGTLVN